MEADISKSTGMNDLVLKRNQGSLTCAVFKFVHETCGTWKYVGRLYKNICEFEKPESPFTNLRIRSLYKYLIFTSAGDEILDSPPELKWLPFRFLHNI